jgi:hypothetical protein
MPAPGMMAPIMAAAAGGGAFALNFVSSGVATSGFTDPQDFASKALGAADATRKIIVAVGLMDVDGGSTRTIDGVTVDGVAASAVTGSVAVSGEGRTQIWIADLGGVGNNNTSGTISINLSGAADRVIGFAAYRMVNAGGTTPVAGASTGSGDPTASLSLPASGWAGVGIAVNSATTTSTPTGVLNVEDLDNNAAFKTITAAHVAAGLASGSNTFSFDLAAPSGNSAASFAAWGP